MAVPSDQVMPGRKWKVQTVFSLFSHFSASRGCISPAGETLTSPSKRSLIILNSTSLSTLCGSSDAGSLPLFLTSSCFSASTVPGGT
ncbi:Uncharacterised protein [Raoultella ornithinolytica]|nr:Uncharacterised protein [Raoultella ornithinolytica]